MSEETGFSTTPPQLNATMGGYPTSLLDTESAKEILGDFESIDPKKEAREADKELDELEQDHPGIVATMFASKSESGLGQVDQAVALRKKIRDEIFIPCITNPIVGQQRLGKFMSEILSAPPARRLSASLAMEPIDYKPSYKPIWPMILKKGEIKDWYALTSGQDMIEWETPIEVDTALAYMPGGEGAKYVSLTGARTPSYPYFIVTKNYTLSLIEWSQRLIKPIAKKKMQLSEELDRKLDTDVLAALVAAVPNASRWGSHPTHITTNSTGTLTFDNFRSTGRFLRHTNSTGIDHSGPRSVAICDALAIDQVEDWGTDVWTPETVEEFNKNGFPIEYDRGTVAGMKVAGFSIVENGLSTTGMKVIYVSTPDRVGSMTPITFQGKQVVVRTIPMIGQDPDYVAISQAQTPPGFSFWINAWKAVAITIPGWYSIAYLNQS